MPCLTRRRVVKKRGIEAFHDAIRMGFQSGDYPSLMTGYMREASTFLLTLIFLQLL